MRFGARGREVTYVRDSSYVRRSSQIARARRLDRLGFVVSASCCQLFARARARAFSGESLGLVYAVAVSERVTMRSALHGGVLQAISLCIFSTVSTSLPASTEWPK